jgi:lauroyl/myristoyl acyltransferase
VATRAAEAGYAHRPRAIHARLLGQASLVLRAFVRVFKRGREAALARIPVDPALGRRVEELLDQHGSLIVAVPHNVCSLFSSIGLPIDRVVVVVRNREGRHNQVSKAVIEQMRIETLEVRHLSPVALARAMMKALAAGKLLVTTLDGNYRKPDAVAIDIFGHPKGFGPWAARIAARRGVPILPCYPRSEDGVVGAWFAEPLVSEDPQVLMEHYVRFFEACILRDPGSWAFLGDKRWRRHLST